MTNFDTRFGLHRNRHSGILNACKLYTLIFVINFSFLLILVHNYIYITVIILLGDCYMISSNTNAYVEYGVTFSPFLF